MLAICKYVIPHSNGFVKTNIRASSLERCALSTCALSPGTPRARALVTVAGPPLRAWLIGFALNSGTRVRKEILFLPLDLLGASARSRSVNT
jgi:hypothetical protein